MDVIAAVADRLPGDLFNRVSHYRHKVFVEKLGWNLQTRNDLELDQFDRPDTIYVVSQDDDGQVNGCARLLPTDRPYLLGAVFPELLNGLPPPCSPEVWEISRFAAVDFKQQASVAARQISSPITIKLLQESIACAVAHGAKRLITVSPIGIERLLHRVLRQSGYHAHRAGPPMIIGGHPIFACWIELGDQNPD